MAMGVLKATETAGASERSYALETGALGACLSGILQRFECRTPGGVFRSFPCGASMQCARGKVGRAGILHAEVE